MSLPLSQGRSGPPPYPKAGPMRQLAPAKRKPRCCMLCRSEDRGEWPLWISRKARQQGQQFFWTNHVFGEFMATPVTETEDRRGASREDGHSSAGATSVTVSAMKKAKKWRACTSCRDAGLSEHPLKQSGRREGMAMHCANVNCAAAHTQPTSMSD